MRRNVPKKRPKPPRLLKPPMDPGFHSADDSGEGDWGSRDSFRKARQRFDAMLKRNPSLDPAGPSGEY